MSGPGVPSTNSNALLSWQSPTTIAGTSISSSHEFQKPCVHITDISFSGHVACQLRISLVPSGNCDVEQALCGLPDLLSGHARIYELVAGDLTPSLANHLRPLLVGLPNTKPSLKSFLNLGDRCISNGSVRSQWAQASIPTSQWNPLHIPTIDSSEHKQYDNLDLSTSFALLSCRNKGVDKLLVLYERPLGCAKEPISRPLGHVCAEIFQQTIRQDDTRSRVRFTKTLLLVLFQLHIQRLTGICHQTFPTESHEELYSGVANVSETMARIRNCTEYHKHVCQLVDMNQLVTSYLEIEPPGSSPVGVAEYILEAKSLSAQLVKISQDNMERYQHGWNAYREILNVRESQGVKRLTMLATVFLPLSLSSSILAMNTRFRDLDRLLFDFVGVFLILGSLALVFYVIIASGNKVLATLARNMSNQSRIPGFRFRRAGAICYAVSWILLTGAFVQSMFNKPVLAFSIIGIGFSLVGTLLTIAPLAISFWTSFHNTIVRKPQPPAPSVSLA